MSFSILGLLFIVVFGSLGYARGLLRMDYQAGQYLNQEGECELPWLGPRLRRKLGELVARRHHPGHAVLGPEFFS